MHAQTTTFSLAPIKLIPSQHLKIWLLFYFLGAIFCILNVEIISWIKVILLFITALQAVYSWYWLILGLSLRSVQQLYYLAQNQQWLLTLHAGEIVSARLLSQSVVTRAFMLLNFQSVPQESYKNCKKIRYCVIICRDQLAATAWRDWYVFLRLYRFCE